MPSAGIDEEEACEQPPPSEEKPGQDDTLQEYGQPPYQDDYDASLKGEPEVPGLDLPNQKSTGQTQKGKKAATCSWDIPALEKAPFLLDGTHALDNAPPFAVYARNTGWGWPQHGAWGLVTTSTAATEPLGAREESIAADEPCFAALAEASPKDEPYVSAPEEKPLPENKFPAEEAISGQELVAKGEAAPANSVEASQAESMLENSAEGDVILNPDTFGQGYDNPFEPTPVPNVASILSTPAEVTEGDILHASAVIPRGRDSGAFHSRPLSVSSSTMTSPAKAAAPEAPTKDRHTIAIKILNGRKVFRFIVVIRECTRTAILNQCITNTDPLFANRDTVTVVNSDTGHTYIKYLQYYVQGAEAIALIVNKDEAAVKKRIYTEVTDANLCVTIDRSTKPTH
ncbi:MAG: hypothetical protein Q9207_005125 [Kuettlingeria erythrocarpa]